MDGGRAGRIYSGHEDRKKREENDNAQWDMTPHPSTPCHDAHTNPVCLPCKQGAPAPCPTPPSQTENDRTVLIGTDEFKTKAGEHLACRKCIRTHILSTIRSYTSWFDEKFCEQIRTELEPLPNDATEVLEGLAKENIATRMWHSYTKTPEYRTNMAGENNSKLDVQVETKGLATYISATCGHRSRRLPSGHIIPIHLPRKDGTTHGNALASYNINKQLVLMAHQMGQAWVSTS